ncbi:MAG: tRNA (adenosine(37)-N6)-dimethylallyltransferase MiaA [Chloroflexi bacterium]|nr:tRNA (adenosine(37)-N6)-dimethylallyltransferase MiaA [Chloroflexota bacterium]
MLLPPLIVIGGATATGKTGLSLDLATALDAEIISADSRQVYRGMDIGTAKATAAERAQVPHHGLDIVDPDQRFTAADFRRCTLAILAGIAARGHPAVLVGGTGLYLRAVARGLPMDSTGHDPMVRDELEARLASEGLPSLLAELSVLAPSAYERVDRANHRRVIRAIERARLEGDVPPPTPEGYPAPVAWLGLVPGPDHAQVIEARARSQFRVGLLEEAAALRDRYGEDLVPFGAMGYREAFDVLAGRATVEASIARTAERTRSYASRQRTWFRAEPDIHWLPPRPHGLEAALAVARSVLGP